MALHIVLPHRQNTRRKSKGNVWLDDDRILSIITTPAVADACRKAEIVYIHRCGWLASANPVICCSAIVAEISGPAAKPTVTFKDVRALGLAVKRRLYGPVELYHEVEP